jgi:hypothetical protein
MKNYIKPLLAGSLVALMSTAALAHDNFSFRLGIPVERPHYDYCTYYNDAEQCGYPEYQGAIYIDGYWRDGRYRYKDWHGHRYFWVKDSWRTAEWHQREHYR